MMSLSTTKPRTVGLSSTERTENIRFYDSDALNGVITLEVTLGKDGTSDFENTGHSDEAKELMSKYYIGEVDQSTVPAKHSLVMSAANTIYTSEMSRQNFIKILQFLVPVMILGLVFTVKA
ncbi:cytochrome b5-like protein [Tanacetum coccineum]